MRYSVDPRHNLLFDPAEDMFSPMAIRYMNSDWPGLFRSQLLQVMPVKELAERFDPIMGAPTKELYSMAGFIFLKEYFNLTIEDAVYHYVVDPCWQFALNVNPVKASMSHATVERYSRYFRDSALTPTCVPFTRNAILPTHGANSCDGPITVPPACPRKPQHVCIDLLALNGYPPLN